MTAVLDRPAYDDPSRPSPPERSRVRRFLRGPDRDPCWIRPALLTLLVATAVLYLWGVVGAGFVNSYYSAAAQAGSVSWKAFFFGSFDASNAITVDKPPASLWLMALSVRAFGLNSFAILLPEALCGVASVGLLYAAVRRAAGPVAGLLAGLVLALMPVATLMFRYNNPDALLVLLMVAAAWALQRALGDGRTRWLLLAGAFIGFGFLAKQLQVLLVVPGLAGAYLVAGPPHLLKRIGQLLLAGLAMVAAAGWWVAIVELMPASARPYIGGSQTNSVLELTLGYNGLGRLNGAETGSVGGTFGWGATGLGRLFGGAIGGQASWLLPAAMALALAGLWARGRAPRTDPARAAVVLWAGWLVVTWIVFSLMGGIFHEYYTVALVPAIGALVGIGAVLLWRVRSRLWSRLVLAAVIAGSGVWGFVLLTRATGYLPGLRYVVLAGGVLAALVLIWSHAIPRVAAGLAALVALAAVLAGPTAYSLVTAGTVYRGSIVVAGPATATFHFFGRVLGPAVASKTTLGLPPPGGVPGPVQSPQRPFPPSSFGTGTGTGKGATARPGAFGNLPPAPRPSTGGGGLLFSSEPGANVLDLLNADASSYDWVVASVGANNAAGYQLSTGHPALALGGFNGSDPSPTLAQFKQWVAQGRIHYFASGSIGASSSGSNDSQLIRTWVMENFTAIRVDNVTLYDLTQ